MTTFLSSIAVIVIFLLIKEPANKLLILIKENIHIYKCNQELKRAELEKVLQGELKDQKDRLKSVMKERTLGDFLDNYRQICLDYLNKNQTGENYRIYRRLYEDANLMYLNYMDRSYDKWARNKYLTEMENKK